jgi:RND family efflux transporter MFP subunit
MLAAAGCRDSAKAAKQAPPASGATAQVTLTPVVLGNADRTVEVIGTIYGEVDVSIAAEVPGRVVEIAADLGDQVEHGAFLARIDPTDYELAVEERRASLAASLAKIGLSEVPGSDVDLSALPLVARAIAQEGNANARLERARKLYERTPPLLSAQDYSDIQTQYDVSRTVVESERLTARSLIADARVQASALRQAEQRLADTRVVAPGERQLRYRVAAREVSIGEVVAEGRTLFRLVASDSVKFRGSVPERYAREVKEGASAAIIVDGFETSFKANLTRISPAVDIKTRSFPIEIEAKNTDGLLKPGSFARARVLLRTQENVRFVPRTAVVQFAGVQRLFSVVDGKVREHRVTLGEPKGDLIEVIDLPEDVLSVVDQVPRGLGAGSRVEVSSPASSG